MSLLTLDPTVPEKSSSIELIVKMAEELKQQSGRMDTLEDELVRMRHDIDGEMYLTPPQVRAVQKAVDSKVFELVGKDKELRAKCFSAVWKAVKDRFRVGNYHVIPRKQFNDALLFIGEWFPLTPIKKD